MSKNEQRIIELETEIRMLRECLAYERAKPAEIKYYPAISPTLGPTFPNYYPSLPNKGDITYLTGESKA